MAFFTYPPNESTSPLFTQITVNADLAGSNVFGPETVQNSITSFSYSKPADVALLEGRTVGVRARITGDVNQTTGAAIALRSETRRSALSASVSDTAAFTSLSLGKSIVDFTAASIPATYTSTGTHRAILIDQTLGSNLTGNSLAISNIFGIEFVADSQANTGRKANIKMNALSGGTVGNAQIADNDAYTGDWFINQAGSVASRFNGPLRVGTTSIQFASFEQASILQLVQAADVASSHSATTIRLVNAQGACSQHQRAFFALTQRTTTADTTDTSSIAAAQVYNSFIPSSGTTYTNTSGDGVSSLLINPTANIGSGSLAISNAQGISFLNNTTNTGTRKTAIRFGAWSGATNNAFIADNNAYTGDWFINSTSTAQTRINGVVGLGGNPSPFRGLRVGHVLLSGADQVGVIVDAVASSTATSRFSGFISSPSTANTTFTCGLLSAFNANNAAKGAASTITYHVMYYGAAPTQGTNNAFISDNEAFTGNWFINSTSTNPSRFGGTIGFGTNAISNGGLRIRHTTMSGVSQYGMLVDSVASSTATTEMRGISVGVSTANSAFTCNLLTAFYCTNVTKGAASTINLHTNYYGQSPTQGSIGNAFIADNTTFTGDWFINSTNTNRSKLGNFYLESDATALPSGFDSETAFLRTGSTGSAPFDQTGSIIIRPRVSSTAGRSSFYVYTGSPSTQAFRIDEAQRTRLSGSLSTERFDVASAATITALDSTRSFVKLTGSTGTTIQGITAGIDGQRLTVVNLTGQNLTVAHENAGATAANRITTMTGADITTTGDGAAEFVYDSGSSRWVCLYVTD